MPYRPTPKPGDPDYRPLPKPLTFAVWAAAAIAAIWVIWTLLDRFA